MKALVEGEARKMPAPGVVVCPDGRDEKRRKTIVDNQSRTYARTI